LVVIGLLLIKAVSFRQFEDLIYAGSFNRTQRLIHQMSLASLPLTSADIYMFDNDGSRLGDVSNSTRIWWFLTTQLGRYDLYPLIWVFDDQAAELILVCDYAEAQAARAPCQLQRQVLAERSKTLELVQATSFETGFEVELYRNLPVTAYSCVN
jgi:hypothetical protein